MSISLLRQLLMKEAVKKSAGSSGIMTINKNIAADVDKLLQKYINDAMQQGVDLDTLSPEQLKMIVAMNSKASNRVISGSSPEGKAITKKLFGKKGEVVDMTGKKIDTSQGIMGGKSVKELMESGQVQKGTDNIKISEKITDREMFKEANKKFNKTDVVADTIARITSMEPVAALKEANKIIGRKGIYKNLDETQSKKILQDTEDWIFQRDPADRYDYKNNRPFRDDPNFDPDDPDFDPEQGFYTGGMVDVEPNLSDIGHGSDALMARTRLVSPDGQATTSTGLNYLLAEDNDNIRVPFSKGKIAKEVLDKGRRGFMKAAGAAGAGIAALKTGLLGFGEKAAPVVEKAVETAKGVPPYFFQLVEKIRRNGKQLEPEFDARVENNMQFENFVMKDLYQFQRCFI